MPIIFFKNENKKISQREGTTILQAAKAAGVLLESPCDAIGTCGKCRVLVEDIQNARLISNQVRHRLSKEELEQGYVLACQTRIYGDITVITQGMAVQPNTLEILTKGQGFSYKIDCNIRKQTDENLTSVWNGKDLLGYEEGDTSAYSYGVVIDIGTTTLVAALVNLISGEEICSAASLNPQSLQAQDVLSRIHIASEEKGLQLLYDIVTKEFNHLIDQLVDQSGILRKYIYEVVYSGNTAMLHLACRINPKSLGQYPYTPGIRGGYQIKAAEHLHISPFGLIYLPPIISAYVGPDITSGVIAAQLDKVEGTALFLDIGTNGEMVLARKGRLYATSTAAGPAFEGMNITCGCRAGKGALEAFRIKDDMQLETGVIGDTAATGICGSGLLDIAGELVRVGIIGSNGKIYPPKEDSLAYPLRNNILHRDGKLCFEISKEVYLTQKDIRQVQLAKGAIRAGIEALLKQLKLTAKEVDEVLIAGSFGYHLRESSLLSIGLLPKEFAGKISFIGNTSMSGGKAFLLNTGLREKAALLVKNIAVLELSKSEDFEQIFIKAMGF